MKTREEYLLAFESTLLEKLSSNFQSLNKNLIYGFSLIFIFILFQFKFLSKTSIAGNEINITEEQLLILMPLILLIPYVLVNNSIRNIARITSLLKDNSLEILKINEQGRPFREKDLEFFSNGVSGIQLQITKWIVLKYLAGKEIYFLAFDPLEDKSTFGFLIYVVKFPIKMWMGMNAFFLRVFRISIWLFLTALLYITPLFIILSIVFKKNISPILSNYQSILDFLNWNILIAFLILIMIFYTLSSNLLLCSLYHKELAELKNKLTSTQFAIEQAKITDAFRYFFTGKKPKGTQE